MEPQEQDAVVPCTQLLLSVVPSQRVRWPAAGQRCVAVRASRCFANGRCMVAQLVTGVFAGIALCIGEVGEALRAYHHGLLLPSPGLTRVCLNNLYLCGVGGLDSFWCARLPQVISRLILEAISNKPQLHEHDCMTVLGV